MSRNLPKVGVALFIWKDDKFLIIKRGGPDGAGKWSVPGGLLEIGETFEAAAAREIMEEVGLMVKNIRVVATTNDIYSGGKHSVGVWLFSDYTSGTPQRCEPHKVLELEWCNFRSLPDDLWQPFWDNLRNIRPDFFKPDFQYFKELK